MDTIFCPKHKIKTGLMKDKSCKSGWRCPKCNQPCVRERIKTKKSEKKILTQMKFDF